MKNTHTLEDSLEEGEARRIAMLGQSDDTAPSGFLVNMRLTPAPVKAMILVSTIVILGFLSCFYALLFVGIVAFLLSGPIVIGDQFISGSYILDPIGFWAALSTIVLTYRSYRSLREAYAAGVRRFGAIARASIVNSFRNQIFSGTVIITCALFFIVLIKYILCINLDKGCPTF